jgi:predicted AlkP superfamily phosphohydrolase/phosphomutase
MGDGSYHGRLFLNVKGREPEGIVEPAQYEEVRDELIAKLEATSGPDGEPLGTKVMRPTGRLRRSARRRARSDRVLRRSCVALRRVDR